MGEDRVDRRLAAIFAADVAGYSRLMGADEEGTLRELKAHRKELVDPKLAEHRGRIVNTAGDGILAEFVSAVDAVRCAVDIQGAMVDRNSEVPADKRIEFRIGINVGDIIGEGTEIFGDGVNVAARLEAFAESGGIMVSRAVHDQVRDKLSFGFQDLGERAFKNIARPIGVYRVSATAGVPQVGARFASAMPKSDLASASRPSIAVLPFTNMSGDPEQEYFSDGITEDIINALSRLRWFFVIARNSTFVYKGQAVDVKQIGRDLNVRYVLEGSVRKSGRRVRITSQLLDASNSSQIWSERYDRELIDIFALQDEITTSVTSAIEPKLLAAESTRTETRSIDDLNAWDLVARAMPRFWKLTAVDSETALRILQEAVQRHPNYAPALSLQAFALLVSRHMGWRPDATADRELTETLARRAAELDENDPWAHMALGHLAFTARQTDEAIRHFQIAIDLNPNFAAAYGFVGYALVFDARSEDALMRLHQALRMSPRDPLNCFFFTGISVAHYMAGRYEEAIKWGRQAVQLRAGFVGAHRILCASLAQAGQVDEAQAVLRHIRQIQPGISLAWIERSIPYTPKPMAKFLEGLRKAGLDS